MLGLWFIMNSPRDLGDGAECSNAQALVLSHSADQLFGRVCDALLPINKPKY